MKCLAMQPMSERLVQLVHTKWWAQQQFASLVEPSASLVEASLVAASASSQARGLDHQQSLAERSLAVPFGHS